MTRRSIRTLITAFAVFGLVAASAAGTAFSVNTVQSVAVASTASGAVVTVPCDGSYDVTWTWSSGRVVGVRAVRTPPSTTSDPQLAFCADTPYAVLVAPRADVEDADGGLDLESDNWELEWSGVTSSVTGSIESARVAPVSGSLELVEGLAVKIRIGPYVPAPLVCEDTATGGDVSLVVVDGIDYCVHRFTSVGSDEFVVVDRSLLVELLVVGGGGGGGAQVGGGGGAGEFIERTAADLLRVEAGTYPVTVGGGGVGGTNTFPQLTAVGGNGGASSILGFTAAGGGGGGHVFGQGENGGQDGGSGGGAGGGGAAGVETFGTAGASVTLGGGLGSDGGLGGGSGCPAGTGGGGGAGGAGAAASIGTDDASTVSGAGGDGVRSAITGQLVGYAGGGGGGTNTGADSCLGVTGGAAGGQDSGAGAGAGTVSGAFVHVGGFGRANSGSGGGGGGNSGASGSQTGGNGGSGVVIVRYPRP